jgi:hypothetical protein
MSYHCTCTTSIQNCVCALACVRAFSFKSLEKLSSTAGCCEKYTCVATLKPVGQICWHFSRVMYRTACAWKPELRRINCVEEWNDVFRLNITVKGKVRPRTGHEGPEGECRYSSTISLTSAQDGGGWLTPRPGCFTPGKDSRYPFYRRLGGAQGLSGRVRKISPPPGFDPRTVQPVASHYTYWAFPTHRLKHDARLYTRKSADILVRCYVDMLRELIQNSGRETLWKT